MTLYDYSLWTTRIKEGEKTAQKLFEALYKCGTGKCNNQLY